MKTFAKQLKWQFILLQKNNIIGISIGVTVIYGAVLFFLRDTAAIDKVLVSLILNDSAVIGYFFIALSIYTEMKHQILPAIFVSPVSSHNYIISRVLSLSIIGTVCSVGPAWIIKGFSFDILAFTIGAMGICLLSTLLGIVVLTYADEFLKFTMLSVPIFLLFVNLPLADYLGAIHLGSILNIFPIQGGLNLIAESLDQSSAMSWFSVVSTVLWIPVFYITAHRFFSSKIIHQ
jgi:fluoroquinolone transport system permease protein